MAAGRRDLLVQTFTCSGAIPRGRVCGLTPTGLMTIPTVEPIVAISNPTFDYEDGSEGDFWLLGITYARAGHSIVAGNALICDTEGRVVPSIGDFRGIGIALESGEEDDLILVYVLPGILL